MKKNLYTVFNELETCLFEGRLADGDKVIANILAKPSNTTADATYRQWVECFIESLGVSDSVKLEKAMARPLPEKIEDYLMRFDLKECFTIHNMAKHLQVDISTPEKITYVHAIFDAVAKKLEKQGWKFKRADNVVSVKQRV